MSFSTKEVNAHLRRGEYIEADRLCREALKTDPGNGEIWHLRGAAAIGMQAFDRAMQYILRAIFHKPGNSAMHLNLAAALAALGRNEEAGRAFQEAVNLDPTNFDALHGLASFQFAQKEYEKAQSTLDAALAVRPGYAAALELDALTAQRLSQFDRALTSAVKAVEINANMAKAHRVAGDVLMRRQDYAAAQTHYEAAVRLKPNDWQTRSNFGLLLSRTAQHSAAVEQYQAAFEHIRQDPFSLASFSLALLTLGRFEEAWALYGAREQTYDDVPRYTLPHLDRLPQAGERVLFTTDQGPGEQIMFAGLLPDLLRTGAEMTVVCNSRLVPLFQRSFPTVRFINRHDPVPGAVAYQMGLAETARWLRRTFADFPAHAGYLVPDPALTQTLRARYAAASPKNAVVGISWRTTKDAKVSDQKTIPLTQWGPILAIPNVTFVSLQYGDCDEELRAAEAAFGVKIVRDAAVDPLRDMDTFTAQTAAMDLVLTTSNTTAHVAGALNVPTATFVPMGYGGLWHWFLERADSPWYPSIQLLRQRTQGDWDPVVDDAAALLAGFAKAHMENAP